MGIRQGAAMVYKYVLPLALFLTIAFHTGSITAMRTWSEQKAGFMDGRRCLFFIGGYNTEIIVAALHENSLNKVASYPSGQNPSILALHPHKPILYAANEIPDGALESFQIDVSTGALSPSMGRISSGGASPAAVTVHPSGKWLLFANYNGGSYGTAKIHGTSGILHPGHLVKVPHLESLRPGMNKTRQEAPHPHQLVTDFSGRFVFACDLGTDQIHLGIFDFHTGALVPNPSGHEVDVVPAGSGPRHLVFSRDGRFAYVINELGCSVQQFCYDVFQGTLKFVASWSTLDDTVVNKGASFAAELAFSPDGRFLYASNRGNEQDSIAAYRVDGVTGGLELLGLDLVGGSGPRHFAFDPSGSMVVVALQFSNSVSLMRWNDTTGRLSLVGSLDNIKAPTYVQFL